MQKFGFIGFGSMGSMLVKQLIQSAMVEQKDIIVTRKKIDKLEDIKEIWPEITVTADACEVADKSDYIFLCMKPFEYLGVLHKMKSAITPDKHIISITGSLMIEDLEHMVQCKISRVLPTVTSEIGEGITLICHNASVTDEEAAAMEGIFHKFTKLFRVKETGFGFASEFTSCGPGFFAAMLQEFVEAGLRYSDSFEKDEIVNLVLQTVYATTKLMLDKNMDFKDVIARVATKGGITEEGVRVMNSGLPEVFDEVFGQTMEKRKTVEETLHNRFWEAD